MLPAESHLVLTPVPEVSTDESLQETTAAGQLNPEGLPNSRDRGSLGRLAHSKSASVTQRAKPCQLD